MAITTKLIVNKADAYCSEPITLTSGMSGAEIEFEFSDEWTGLGRTAVFTSGSVTKYVILDSTNKCMIPAECLVTARQSIVVGVFGTDGDDIAIPTIYCALGLIEPGTSVTGSEPGAITQSLYNQVTALLTSTTTELGNVKEASIKSADATVNSSTGVPSVSVTYEWIDASDHSKGKKATFAFANLKGESGQLTAAYATIDSGVGTPSVDVTMSGTTIAFAFHNLKGANGTDGSDGEDGEDGVSPTVTIIPITGGHRVTITDAIHPSGQAFDVMDGQSGASSWTEITGKPTTVSGYGITDAYTKTEVDTSLGGKITNPASKSNGQILTYNGTDWVAQNPSGGGTWGSITGTLSDQTDLNTVLTQQSSQIGNLGESIIIDGTATSNTKLEVDTSGSGTTKTVYETSEVYNKTEVDNKLGIYTPEIYSAKGAIATDADNIMIGVGIATVEIVGTLARIDYSYRITTANTSASMWDWGLKLDNVISLANIPYTMSFVSKDFPLTMFSTENKLDATREEKSGVGMVNNRYIQPARVYQDSGTVGGWATASFVAGCYFKGVAYATVTRS